MHTTGDTINIFSVIIRKTDGVIDISATWVFALIAACLFFIPLAIKWISSKGSFEFNEGEFGIGSQKLKFKTNYSNLQIAYKMWVELSTRKVGLLVDPNKDVIAEVYDSWYGFFGVMRDLLKEIPAQTLKRDKSARELVSLAARILNEELRPHMTDWQARFRHWYKGVVDIPENKDVPPQELQKKFPGYADLITDMQRVNGILVNYRRGLESMVLSGRNLKLWWEKKDNIPTNPKN